jgi:hypothetical protein
VLARIIEQAGVSTVIVTMMPVWSERLGAPRTLGVEHPYGQPIGPAGDRSRQREVLHHALTMLERAQAPNHLEHSDYEWPDPRSARRSWHPPQPSPIVAQMLAYARGD